MRLLSLSVLLVVVGAAGGDPAAELKALEGTWSPVDFKIGGKSGVPESIKDFKLTIAGGTYSLAAGKETDKGTLKLDDKATPKGMDVVGTDGPSKGKTVRAIYKLDGDKLTICYALDGKDRPTAFESTKENGWLLATYQRGK